jgi:hypothetical protein
VMRPPAAARMPSTSSRAALRSCHFALRTGRTGHPCQEPDVLTALRVHTRRWWRHVLWQLKGSHTW